MKVLAIIPAAGAGVRMGSETPKQFLSLEGVPIVVHTLRKFSDAESIDEIFLGVRPEDMERAYAELQKEQFSRRSPFACARRLQTPRLLWSTTLCGPLYPRR
jgi:2-C-methyl-D-erythritol 4-phosphate cytidylyltransferase